LYIVGLSNKFEEKIQQHRSDQERREIEDDRAEFTDYQILGYK
jgi:hypothetical protein